jgi:hypothetical protein
MVGPPATELYVQRHPLMIQDIREKCNISALKLALLSNYV